MDDIFSIIFFIWIGYALLEGIVRKKQIPPPLQLPSERRSEEDEVSDFEIPTLANDPNVPIDLAQNKSVYEIFKPAPTKQLQPQQTHHQVTKQSDNSIQEETKINISLTQSDAMNAMILSEIFNKPKSLRRR